MQTLGLVSDQKPTDGFLKRLFWPTIENAYDVDLLGKQGFWLCLILAFLSMLGLVVTRHPYIGSLVAVTYYLAGVGVRERSLGAAMVILLCYATDRIAGVLLMPGGGGNPVVMIAALMLLVSNVRGTVMARKWSATGTVVEEAEFPDRASLSFWDRFANFWPKAVWPSGQFIFYPLAAALFLSTVAGVVRLTRQQHVRTAPPHLSIELPSR